MNRRSSDGERASRRAPRSAPLLQLVPEALADQRDLIQVEANPTLQREAEMPGEPKVGEAIVMPPH